MAGEIAADEQSDDPDLALKTNVFIFQYNTIQYNTIQFY